MSISLLRRLLMKEAVKDTAGSSGIMSINKNIAAKVEQQLQRYVNDAMQQGVDLDTLSPEQLKMIVQMNKPKPPRVIAGDSPEGRGITEALLGKRGEVVDFPQKRSFKQEVDDMIKDGTITKGARGMKKSKKVQDREMFQDANKRLKTDVNKIIADIKAMDPMDSMKEANSVIGRKGAYKNLTPEESKKILKDTEDHIFERDIPEEDFADGGVAGLLGERTGFQGGGASYKSSSKSSKSKSKSSTSKGPAGGASAGGNYGGNVNPNQTYAGRTLSQRPSNYGGTGPSTTSGGGGGPPGTNTGGGTTTTPTTTQPSFRELIRQKQILDYLNSLEEEDLALGIGPAPKVLGTIFKEGVKGVKPKIGKKGLGLEYLKEMDPYGNSLKFNLGTEYKDLLKGKLKPKLELKGTKGDLEYGFGMDKDKNINFGIKMPFGKQPRVAPRNFKNRLTPDISKFNFEDMTGIPSQAPTNMQLAMITDTQKDIIDKQGKMGQLTGAFDPNATFNAAKMFDDKGSSGVFGIGAREAEPMTREEFDAYINEKGYADGGPARQNFAMGRRAFLKMLAGTGAGIAGLKSGIIGTGGKEVTKKAVTETVKSAGSTPPPYFFKLAEKIKKLGSDTTPTNDRTIAKSLKSKDGRSDYILEEDVASGDTIIKKVNKEGDEMITDVQIMELRKGEVVRGKDGKPKKTPDEYEEVTEANARIEGDVFNDPYYSDGIEIDDILREVDDIPVPKASGGIARMLGE
jgi:hypothetical protein